VVSRRSNRLNALAGINSEPAAPGFARIRIEPQVVRDLNWASGSLETPRGPVAASWNRSGDRLRLEVTVPAVWTKDLFQAGAPGITKASQTDTAVVFETGLRALRLRVGVAPRRSAMCSARSGSP
jgi:hypothetical protein